MNENNKNSKKDNGSASLSIGMCIGLAVGTAIGAATHNIGMWMPRDWGQLQGGKGEQFLLGGGGGRDSVLGTKKMLLPPPCPVGHTLSTPTSQESRRKVRPWRK